MIQSNQPKRWHKPMLGLALISLWAIGPNQANAWQKDKADTSKFNQKTYKDLPLKADRLLEFNTKEGTWVSVDVSPDGKTIAFDMLGDLYTMPIGGGKATRITDGMAYDTHPRYSPDGKSIVFTSDRSGSDNAWIMDLETEEFSQITKGNNVGLQEHNANIFEVRRCNLLGQPISKEDGGFQIIRFSNGLTQKVLIQK